MKVPPSIFNDVLGPVMRGPSSSHSAAANRIGRLMRALAGEKISTLVVRYDPNGSLVTTHKEQGSDLGLYGGILGWTPDDPRLPTFEQVLKDEGIEIDLHYESYDAPHPNFYRLEAHGVSGTIYHFDAISTGGGMIETISIDGIPSPQPAIIITFLSGPRRARTPTRTLPAEIVSIHKSEEGQHLINLSLREEPDQTALQALAKQFEASRVRHLPAVLPVLARNEIQVPFLRAGEMLKAANTEGIPLWKMALRYESERGGIPEEQIMAQMDHIRGIMEGRH
jgi:L-serine dehydratase